MISPLPTAVISSALERAINTALKYDPGSRHRLARLSGKTVQLSSVTPSATFFIRPHNDGISVSDHADVAPDTVVKGEVVDLLKLLLSPDVPTLANTAVDVTGDTRLLRELREVARNIDIDWEEPLNAVLGTVPGHQVAEAIRASFSWANTARLKTNEKLSEYLTEELRMIPSESELNAFYQNIDALRSDTERLEAKINTLLSRLKRDQE